MKQRQREWTRLKRLKATPVHLTRIFRDRRFLFRLETPEHAKQVEQLRFRADAIQNQLSKRRGLPLNDEDAHRTADLRDLWRQIHKIRRESGVRRKVGVVGWGAFGLTVADHMPYEGPDVVIIGKGRIGGPASTSQEILNVGAGGGRGIKGPRVVRI